jgi:hypothetical protein
MFSWRAISALLAPARWSFRIWLACFPTVTGRPRCFPFSRASAMPARIRSRRISCSKAANTESSPAMARPVGVVRSRASVSDTKATPSSATSFKVTTRSTSDRPQRSSLFFDLNCDCPATLRRILTHGAHLQRQSLLVVRGDSRIQARAKHFRRFLALAENPLRFHRSGCPFGGHFTMSESQGLKLMLSAMRPNHLI